jgi:dynein assembly factor 5
LFSVELEILLEEMKEDYETWDKNTPQRFIFDMLVKRSTTAVVDYWETILMIMAANVEGNKEVELRMDMLSLLEHFLKTTELHSTIIFYSEIILKMIIMPCMVWKAGKPNVSIRKAAIVCLIKLID